VYWAFVLLGAASVFPWNAYISAPDYWAQLFGAQANIEFYYAVCYMAPEFVSVLFMTLAARQAQFLRCIAAGFVINAALLVLVPVVDNLSVVSVSAKLGVTYGAIAVTGTALVALRA
jgi:equilibrative nucleoside transporter 1/2/3